MITAKFKRENNSYSFEICGHANHSEYGTDIVCAYASSLVISIVNEMVEYGADLNNGDEVITVSFVAVQTSQSPIDFHLYRLFKMLLDNLEKMETEYPQNVKVIVS